MTSSGGLLLLKYGNTNTYYGNGLLLDTDLPGKLPGLLRALGRHGLGVPDVRYLLATHYHPDHVGLAGELTRLGVRLLIAENQTDAIHLPDAVLKREAPLRFVPPDETKAIVLRFAESRAFLSRLGLAGELVPTESHSPDGVALILDDGHCYVGDVEPQQYVDGYAPGCPLQTDWERILRFRPRVIHYGHANDQTL